MWNPALKNETTQQFPIQNHYKCYECQGAPVNVPVILIDQFGTWQATVTAPRYFCSPAEKRVGTLSYPIVDANRVQSGADAVRADPQGKRDDDRNQDLGTVEDVVSVVIRLVGRPAAPSRGGGRFVGLGFTGRAAG
jgi:hypothetical protein